MTADAGVEIRARLEKIADSFGKIGLLIDDASDARSRTARELYGGETLPDWWLQARSIECGAWALEAFLDLCGAAESARRVHGVTLIDRFLPVTDNKERSVAWDHPRRPLARGDQELCEKMRAAAKRLIAAAMKDRDSFVHAFITSYPHLPLDPGQKLAPEKAIPWSTRSIELLYQLRRKVDRLPLRSYGPERFAALARRAPEATPRYLDPGAAAQWKARAWEPTIEALASTLANPGPVQEIVLFLGAGASLAQGLFGAGMPPTWWLLEETCRTIVHGGSGPSQPAGRLKQQKIEAPPRPERGRCHGDDPIEPARISFNAAAGVTPIDWIFEHLLEKEQHRAHQLQCGLETIFSREWNENSRWKYPQFCEVFRRHMERFDHGFPFHCWLLAQMPWTRVITTNFDSCFERAAFAAASELAVPPEVSKDRLALGSVFPQLVRKVARAGGRDDVAGADRRGEPQDSPPPKPGGAAGTADPFEEQVRSSRLFKPYGSLLSPAELAISAEELKDCEERLTESLQGLAAARKGWLVVIGHSMNDRYVDAALNTVQGIQQRYEMVWVIPEAYQRCAPKVGSSGAVRSRWEDWIDSKMKERMADHGGQRQALLSGPLPGTALEFTADLWGAFQRARSERA